MKLTSLKKRSPEVSFEEAIFIGLAPDGGLYVPKDVPQFNHKELQDLKGKTFAKIAHLTLHKWLHDELSSEELEEVITKAFNFPIPLVKVGPYHVLELFHGPTMSFKDIAACVLARLTEIFVRRSKRLVRVLVATSGDTGGAIAHGFANVKDTQVVVLYPKGRVSHLQEEQLTRVAQNVIALEVDGDFDDCQRLVKKAFVDPDLRELALTSANSINIGRLLPQIIYYVYLASLMLPEKPTVVIPSGNFGNVCGALLAQKMGIPFEKIVIACNANDAVVDFARTGRYKAKKTVRTFSNAMDVGDPSNFPRVLHFCGYSHEKFLQLFEAVGINDSKTLHTMLSIWHEYRYQLDPHTAVAWAAADAIDNIDRSIVIIATASPLKFAEEIEKNLRITLDNSSILRELKKNKINKITIKNSYSQFKQLLLDHFEPVTHD
jgi:threonine synthase